MTIIIYFFQLLFLLLYQLFFNLFLLIFNLLLIIFQMPLLIFYQLFIHFPFFLFLIRQLSFIQLLKYLNQIFFCGLILTRHLKIIKYEESWNLYPNIFYHQYLYILSKFLRLCKFILLLLIFYQQNNHLVFFLLYLIQLIKLISFLHL